ncbi:MAG: hypothetical protein PVH21_07490 [Myxococcales bacterium]
MNKPIATISLLSLCACAWLMPSSAHAVPKMSVKVAVGVGSTTLVPRVPEIDLYDPGTGEYISTVGGRNPSTFPNWGLQLGARVTAGKIFGEMAIGFSRFYFEVTQSMADIARAQGTNATAVQLLVGQRARMNSLEIPLTAGYVPYKNPYFKLFLYGGWVSTFNLRGFVDINGNRKALKFRPKEIPGFPLAIYVAGARFGTQFDLGPLNFDFNYTISMNSFTKSEFRTNAHIFKFFVGWLF